MPVPYITSNYKDYNLGMSTAAPRQGKTIYVVGTSADGVMHQPVYVANATDAANVFGDISDGNLVRALNEILDTPGSKQVYAIRVGNGNRAYLELREKATYTGTHTPTETTDYATSLAIRIEATYPSEKYNNAILGYTILEDYGTVLFFYNPATEVTSYFKFNTDPDDTTVTIHNVKELAAAMNADPNIAPWFLVTTQTIRSNFECWVLPQAYVPDGSSESDYGIIAYGKTWNQLLEDHGKLPGEWADGWSYDGYVSRFSLPERIVDTTGGGGDTDIEFPGNTPPGWEVLGKGIVTGTAPRKAFETAVNNISSFNSLYSLSYTGRVIIDTISNLNTLTPKPFNTQGRRGFSTGSLNPYKIDGLQMKRPNAAPTNEIDPLDEDISTWASEYAIWFDKYPISQGTVGEGNDGTVEFGCFLPIDFSGWPRYWGSKHFPTETDPVKKIVIGHPFATSPDFSSGADSNLYTLFMRTGEKANKIDGDTIVDGPLTWAFGTRRGGIFTNDSGAEEYYRLPPYYLATVGGTDNYPYKDMIATRGSDPSTYDPIGTYYTLNPAVAGTASASTGYISYFLGPLSLNYDYKPIGFTYDVVDTSSTIDENYVLTAYANPGGAYQGQIFDISYAISRTIAETEQDLNGVTFSNMTDPSLNVEQRFGKEGSGLYESARAVVYPTEVRKLTSGDKITATTFALDLTGSGLTALDGDIVIINNRMFVYDTTRVYPDPSTYGLSDTEDILLTDALLIRPSDASTATEVDENALHFAEILAGKCDSATPDPAEYKFYDNYGTQAIPVIEYSLDGNSWFEIEPKYITQMKWLYNGQDFPNDSAHMNKFKITFLGSNIAGESPDWGTFQNDIWSIWKGLWEYELSLDSSLKTKYPHLYYDSVDNPTGFFKDIIDDVEAMNATTYAEFLEWAGDTVPPFMEINDSYTALVLKSNAQFRISAVTTKGHLTQTYSRSAVEASGKADTYFLYGDKMLFGSPPPAKYIISYLTKIDYIPNADYTIDSDGVITFTNPDKQPFGVTYDPFKRFILGFDFNYLPEWFDLPANMSLHGGSSGIHMDTQTKYEELKTVLEDIRDFPPEILIPVDYYLDETVEAYSIETGLPYLKNAGLKDILSDWLDAVNLNAWTTRAVVPMTNPTDTSLSGIRDWVTKLSTISPTDPLRPANIMTSLDNKWIDVVAFPFLYSKSGLTFTTNFQCVYGALLASNTLPNILTNIPIPTSHRPLIQIRESLVNKIVNNRINTVIYNDMLGSVIADFVTGAALGSDYNRGLNREIASAAVKVCRDTWSPYAGKVGTKTALTAFDNTLGPALHSIGGIEQIQHQLIQNPQMKVDGKIKVRLSIVPFGELRHMDIDVELKRSV